MKCLHAVYLVTLLVQIFTSQTGDAATTVASVTVAGGSGSGSATVAGPAAASGGSGSGVSSVAPAASGGSVSTGPAPAGNNNSTGGNNAASGQCSSLFVIALVTILAAFGLL